MIHHLIPRIFTAAAVIAVPLALAIPASAAGAWHAADLTAMAKAPAAASAPSGYETFLQGGQPATVRTVFRTASGHIEELSLQADKKWHAADLTAIAKAPAAASAPFGYFADRTGQGQGHFARVVYRTTAGHIEELSVQAGQPWHAADLTAITGAPAAASAPFGYTTEFAGQPGKVARVIYRTPGSHIIELSLPADGQWHAADLSVIAGAPAAASAPFGYITVLDGQGMVARVVYRTPGSHIVELSVQAGQQWHAADLSAIAGAPAAATAPFGYETFLDNGNGSADAARVVYRTPGSHIVELNVQPGRPWIAADLTAITAAPAAASAPFGYETGLDGQGQVARVVYRTTGSHIVELSIAMQPGGAWHAADLSVIAKATDAVSAPVGYETLHNGPNVARVVYRNKRNHITQLSVS